ncbi:MAG TPA: hypothetical protein VF275_07590 [Gammaproteobacteria bacterium]
MEDLRKLLDDHEAEIAPESLGYLLRGLNALMYDLLQDCSPSDPKERMRHNEMLHSVAFSAQLISRMLARWLGEHVDSCREMH